VEEKKEERRKEKKDQTIQKAHYIPCDDDVDAKADQQA